MHMELSANQIQLIDKALIKAGINYIDIRIELTDHIAAALEQKDERFEHHLKGYMLEHKGELKKLNLRFIVIAMGKAYKQLFATMLKPLFLIITAVIFATGYAINAFFGRADTFLTMFLIFIGACCLITGLSGPYLFNALFNKSKQYSYGFGFTFIYMLLFYPTLYLFIHQEYFNNIIVVLCFTMAITLSLAMYVTVKQLNKKYKLQYK
jgi:hypothetical protein